MGEIPKSHHNRKDINYTPYIKPLLLDLIATSSDRIEKDGIVTLDIRKSTLMYKLGMVSVDFFSNDTVDKTLDDLGNEICDANQLKVVENFRTDVKSQLIYNRFLIHKIETMEEFEEVIPKLITYKIGNKKVIIIANDNQEDMDKYNLQVEELLAQYNECRFKNKKGEVIVFKNARDIIIHGFTDRFYKDLKIMLNTEYEWDDIQYFLRVRINKDKLKVLEDAERNELKDKLNTACTEKLVKYFKAKEERMKKYDAELQNEKRHKFGDGIKYQNEDGKWVSVQMKEEYYLDKKKKLTYETLIADLIECDYLDDNCVSEYDCEDYDEYEKDDPSTKCKIISVFNYKCELYPEEESLFIRN